MSFAGVEHLTNGAGLGVSVVPDMAERARGFGVWEAEADGLVGIAPVEHVELLGSSTATIVAATAAVAVTSDVVSRPTTGASASASATATTATTATCSVEVVSMFTEGVGEGDEGMEREGKRRGRWEVGMAGAGCGCGKDVIVDLAEVGLIGRGVRDIGRLFGGGIGLASKGRSVGEGTVARLEVCVDETEVRCVDDAATLSGDGSRDVDWQTKPTWGVECTDGNAGDVRVNVPGLFGDVGLSSANNCSERNEVVRIGSLSGESFEGVLSSGPRLVTMLRTMTAFCAALSQKVGRRPA